MYNEIKLEVAIVELDISCSKKDDGTCSFTEWSDDDLKK